MSGQEAEPTAGNSDSLNVEGAAAASPVAVQLVGATEAPAAPANDAPKAEASCSTAPKIEIDASSQASTPEADYVPGKVIVMSPRARGFGDHEADSAPEAPKVTFDKRRFAALAAAIALAVVAGALGGAMATAAFMHGGGQALAGNENQGAIQASLSRIDADMQALKAGLEHTSKLGMSQFSKTSDRLDKLERAQAEPAAKLARLSEAVDKLRVAAPASAPVAIAAAPAAAKETTGSIPATAGQQAAVTTVPKSEIGRLPTVDGWVLRDVDRGSALIDGRRGIYEVYAGDVVPGLGRIDAIRRQDGRWVVVTSRGLIVAR
jgi:hypothetical protein